jgi:uncharacterized membrane-anchored protein
MAEGRWRGVVALLTAVAALAAVNLSIADKERQLAHGRVVCLELAPVDPRSLLQGDYMQLNYRLADDITRLLPRRTESQPWQPELVPADGRAVVTLDPRAVASFVRLDDGRPLAAGEILLRYRVRAGRLRFASDAFFFQEGTADAYENARYGCYRVGADGAMLLTSLHDEGLDKLPLTHQ